MSYFRSLQSLHAMLEVVGDSLSAFALLSSFTSRLHPLFLDMNLLSLQEFGIPSTHEMQSEFVAVGLHCLPERYSKKVVYLCMWLLVCL